MSNNIAPGQLWEGRINIGRSNERISIVIVARGLYLKDLTPYIVYKDYTLAPQDNSHCYIQPEIEFFNDFKRFII